MVKVFNTYFVFLKTKLPLWDCLLLFNIAVFASTMLSSSYDAGDQKQDFVLDFSRISESVLQ